jgi:tryptophan synthase alpha chain
MTGRTNTRIEQKFSELKAKNRAALIPFIMGYDPDLATSSAILAALPAAGADMIEIGIPFSDPMADGAIIQAAGIRALTAGANVAGIIEMVRNFRQTDEKTPIILMGYFNPIYRYGVEKFCGDTVLAGVDGLIIVDLPPEEEAEIHPFLHGAGLDLIRLIAPTSDDVRLPLLAKSATGFVYYIAVAGITGAKSATAAELAEKLAHIRKFTSLPIAVGFGIKTAQQVQEISAFADCVVVGSALVDVIAKAGKGEKAVQAATDFVRLLTKQ